MHAELPAVEDKLEQVPDHAEDAPHRYPTSTRKIPMEHMYTT